MKLFALNFLGRTSDEEKFDFLEYIDLEAQPSKSDYYLNFWDLQRGDEVAITYSVLQKSRNEKKIADKRFPGCLVGKIVAIEKDTDNDVVFKFRASQESLYLVILAEFVSFL